MGLFEDRFPVLPGHPDRAELPAASFRATRTVLLRTAAMVAVILALLAVVLLAPRLLLDWDLADGQAGDRARAVNDIRDSLLKALGGLVVVLGALLTWRQLQLNRHGQITEAFASAITQLGDASLDVRLGGIYALERIARSSPADLQAIEEVLCLFVKNRTSGDSGSSRPCEIDVNTVLTVLGRRRTSGPVRPLKLDRVGLVDARLRYAHLSEADLHFADLTGANLRGADLTRADLTGTSLRRTVLVETNLYQADLRDAVLAEAMAEEADLRGTDLTRADLTAAHLRQARLGFADLRGANLGDADLTEASLRGALADNDTTWPDGFDPAAAGVTSRPDAPPIRPRNYKQAMAWPQNPGPDRTLP
jgi:uncharacterized protein YjbI with pentapeptide repeats